MSDRCCQCNRKLTDIVSKGRGFGPVCWVKHVAKKEAGKDQGVLFDEPQLPFHGDIILQRGTGGKAISNVPHKIVQHSPNGFEWGYGGSGPGELALNILSMFTDQETAEELHQVFKWDYIAKLPHEGGTIKGRDVKRWLRQHRKEVS